MQAPAYKLPAMLAMPMMANDQLATVGGKPHKSTSVGKWVTKKAM